MATDKLDCPCSSASLFKNEYGKPLKGDCYVWEKYYKLFVLILACFLIVYGFGYYRKFHTIAMLDGKIKMGKYKEAMASIQELQSCAVLRTIEKLKKEDALIAYNTGVLYTLMENKKKASAEYRKAMETSDPTLKARAIYNNANIIATDIDFSRCHAICRGIKDRPQ